MTSPLVWRWEVTALKLTFGSYLPSYDIFANTMLLMISQSIVHRCCWLLRVHGWCALVNISFIIKAHHGRFRSSGVCWVRSGYSVETYICIVIISNEGKQCQTVRNRHCSVRAPAAHLLVCHSFFVEALHAARISLSEGAYYTIKQLQAANTVRITHIMS